MRRFRESLTTRGAAFLASGLVLVLAGLALGQHDLSRIGTALCALPLLAGLMGRRHDLSLVVEREAHPSRITIDEPAVVLVTISNPAATCRRIEASCPPTIRANTAWKPWAVPTRSISSSSVRPMPRPWWSRWTYTESSTLVA